ncbi:MAG: type IV toxin-antitoxin system AbiEi family antitoxin domain-containing protein [Thermoanaerobaculia bacterium]
MTERSAKALVLKELKRSGIARTRDFESLGVSRKQIRRLADKGIVERVSWGLYRRPNATLDQWHSFAEAARRVPGGVICLLSALRFHDLTTQNPWEIWMAIEGKAWRPPRGNPPIRIVQASGAAFREGTEKHRVGGVPVRVYGVAKTVTDCFKYRNKVGLDVALEALREAWRARRFTMEEIGRFARICRVEKVMRPYLEALVA